MENPMIRTLILMLVFFVLSASAATVEVLSVPSKKMGKNIPVTLILPDAYEQKDQRFPVLYLLHGAGDDYRGWHRQTKISRLADEYDIVVVCPDGGRTSWYFDSPVDPAFQYETFVAKECVNYIDTNYRTQAHRNFRALCGLSMGGHGSLFLAIRHPDTFSVAVPLSGGVDIRPFPRHWEIALRLGAIETHRENWETYTVINQAKKLNAGELAISIDCGTSDFFLGVNRALHQQLLADGISHNYEEHPGAHNWGYWREAIKRQMPFIARHFKNQPAD